MMWEAGQVYIDCQASLGLTDQVEGSEDSQSEMDSLVEEMVWVLQF